MSCPERIESCLVHVEQALVQQHALGRFAHGIEHKFSTRLAQAEALANEQAHLLNSDLEVKIERVGGEVQKAKVGLSRWMLTGWVTQTGLLATLFWYFSSGPPTP